MKIACFHSFSEPCLVFCHALSINFINFIVKLMYLIPQMLDCFNVIISKLLVISPVTLIPNEKPQDKTYSMINM